MAVLFYCLQWSMISLSNEFLTLSPAQYLPNCNNTLPCTFVIGITGFIAEASYTLVVTTGSSDVVMLIDGTPQVSHCHTVPLALS